MVQRIKLMADFDCYPLWDMDDGGDIAPTELPLSEATIERLLNWQKIYDGIIDWNDPASAGFATIKEERAFERKGISLWCQLKRELGDDYQVFYKSQLHQRVLNPYESRLGNYLDALLRTSELPQFIQKRRSSLAEKEVSKKQFIAPITVAVTRGKSIEAQGKSRSVDKVKFNDALYFYQASDHPPHIVRANRTARKLIRDLATIESDQKKD
ncbi:MULTISPECIES: hypothetical protein [unclassified Microcoleus]|uniref:hypothetical protein n=1 Tax=unclassified Microcoleus TaxID=2642155 RepID=UPI002FD73123